MLFSIVVGAVVAIVTPVPELDIEPDLIHSVILPPLPYATDCEFQMTQLDSQEIVIELQSS